MMAILGAFTAFVLCIVGPLAAKLSLEGRNVRDMIFLVIAIPMAAWGSTVAFMPKND
jgi:solute carrier family 32 (vesicular inhibitory amino acid transporter)